jgi:hypothetical protein
MTDGSTSRAFGGALDLEELRRRNSVAVGMDVLYLVTTAFFAILLTMGFWPIVIAAVPLGALLFFGLLSSRAFFLAQVLTVLATLAASYAGLLPL